MSNHLGDLSLLTLCFLLAIEMTVEGILLLRSKKPTVPISSRVIYWASGKLIGKEETIRRFGKQNTPENVRAYAAMALISGGSLFLAGVVYLNWMLSH
jgi:hypothetical protein